MLYVRRDGSYMPYVRRDGSYMLYVRRDGSYMPYFRRDGSYMLLRGFQILTSDKEDLYRGVAGTLPERGSLTMSSTISMLREWRTELMERFPPTFFISVDDFMPWIFKPTACSNGYKQHSA